MRNFINEIGCTASFEETLTEEIIQERLSWLPGKNWREINK